MGRLRESRSQSRVRASAIVMASVFAKDSLKMAFVEWDEKVEALAPDGPDQPFAICIRFGCPDRRFQDRTPKPFNSESQAEKIVSRS